MDATKKMLCKICQKHIFKCEYCEGTFRAKSSLNVHIKTRHVETRTFNKSCQTDFSEEYGNEVGFDESFRLNLSDEVKILGVLLKNFKWL